MPVINQKGGVGKTATTVNLGAALAQRGKKMLLIDLDPQGHLTTHLGLDRQAKGAGIYEVLTKGLPLEAAIHAYSPTISVVPSQIDLAAAEAELIATVGREVILRDILASREWPFDICMVDCPPSLGVLTLNALSAATQVLIPLQPHFLALQGVGKLFETILLVAQRINPRLRVAGMVMCLYEPATRLAGEVIADLSAFLDSARNSPVPWRDARLMQTRIRRNVKLAECPSYGQSIYEYEPRSHGAIDYLALADELLSILTPGSVPAAAAAVNIAPPTPAVQAQPIATNDNASPAKAPQARTLPPRKPVSTPASESNIAAPASPKANKPPAAQMESSVAVPKKREPAPSKPITPTPNPAARTTRVASQQRPVATTSNPSPPVRSTQPRVGLPRKPADLSRPSETAPPAEPTVPRIPAPAEDRPAPPSPVAVEAGTGTPSA